MPDYPGDVSAGEEEASASSALPDTVLEVNSLQDTLLDSLPDYPFESDEDHSDANDDADTMEDMEAKKDDVNTKKEVVHMNAKKDDVNEDDVDAEQDAQPREPEQDAEQDAEQEPEPAPKPVVDIIEIASSDDGDDIGAAPKSLQRTMQFAAQVPPVNSKEHRDRIRMQKKPAAADGPKKQDCRQKMQSRF